MVLATPAVRSLALTDRDRSVHIVGRVHRQHEVVAAVATHSRLQVQTALAGRVHSDATPSVRQGRVTDGVALLEVIARVHRHIDAVDVDTSIVVVHRVGVKARLGERAATPLVAAASAEGDRLVGVLVRRVHRQYQHIDAVATGSRCQGVVVRAGGTIAVTSPAIRGLGAANDSRVTERVC